MKHVLKRIIRVTTASLLVVCSAQLFSDDKTDEENNASALSFEAIVEYAKDGDLDAIHGLCYRFLQGIGVEKNYPNAYFWCKKGATLGHSGSQTLFAEIHNFGHIPPVDYSTAFDWYQKAAEQGHQHAQYMLFIYYAKGIAVEQSNDLAIKWLIEAAKRGHQGAIDALKKIQNPDTET